MNLIKTDLKKLGIEHDFFFSETDFIIIISVVGSDVTIKRLVQKIRIVTGMLPEIQ